MPLRTRRFLVVASTALTATWLLFRKRPGPGRFVRRFYVNRAGTRFYKMYLPQVYRGQSLPLVVMLHGCKQTPEEFAAGTRMNQAADELGFIAVYPAQAWRANVERCWNWFRERDQQRDGGEPAIIAGITRQVIARFNADARRVYIAGFSAGGSMAAIMATTYPELYAAVGIHSGLPYASARGAATAAAAMQFKRLGAVAPRLTIPTIVFHGDKDTTVHPSNSDYSITGEFQAETGEAGGRSYTRTRYGRLEHWLVHGAGHAWSGGDGAASYADSRGPDATHEMLRFFLATRAA
jgi:poly(hydroxyalkanoate) depolymerase family esterase